MENRCNVCGGKLRDESNLFRCVSCGMTFSRTDVRKGLETQEQIRKKQIRKESIERQRREGEIQKEREGAEQNRLKNALEEQKKMEKERRELEKQLEENRKKALKKAALAAGATAAAAGGAYAASRAPQQPPPPPPPPPAYPRRESPILKYLLTIIVLGAIGFGLYKYGPDIWGNVQAILPQDFMVFLSCLGKVLTSGDMKSIENCFQGGGQLELPQRPEPTYVNPNIIGLSVGYGDTKRPETPIGGKKYTTYVKIENYNPDEPVEVKKVWGNLEYEATENDITLPGRKELTPEDNECTEDNPCEIRKSKKLVTLVSGEELDCTTKNYDRLIVYAEFDYDTNESIDYVVGRTEEAVEAAKTHELVFKPSPVDIQFEFSPEYWVTLDTYLPIIVRGLDAYSPTKKVRIIFENKGSGKAIINGIKIERTGTNSESDPNTFAKLKGCNNCFGKVDIIEEGKIIPVEKVELYQDPLQCVCEYSIHNPNDFLGEEDPYKTFSFDVSLFYTYRKTLTKTNIPEADLDSYCKETTTTAITRTTTTTTTIGSGRGHIP